MGRSRFTGQNYMPPMGRIDTRPQNDPAVADGMRKIHRGMNGEVIGGYAAEGQALGVKNRSRGYSAEMQSQITPPEKPNDAEIQQDVMRQQPKTTQGTSANELSGMIQATSKFQRDPNKWMIDSYDRGTVKTFDPVQRRKDELQLANKAALEGRFGTGSQKRAQTAGRKSLFRDMQMAGSGGLTPEMRQRATNLGVDEEGWKRGTKKLNEAPAMLVRR